VNEVLLPGRLRDELVGVLVEGWQRSFQPLMKFSMAVIRSPTGVKLPRRMVWRVMMAKKVSATFSHGNWSGSFNRGFICR
jgi:hypothetical protein